VSFGVNMSLEEQMARGFERRAMAEEYARAGVERAKEVLREDREKHFRWANHDSLDESWANGILEIRADRTGGGPTGARAPDGDMRETWLPLRGIMDGATSLGPTESRLRVCCSAHPANSADLWIYHFQQYDDMAVDSLVGYFINPNTSHRVLSIRPPNPGIDMRVLSNDFSGARAEIIARGPYLPMTSSIPGAGEEYMGANSLTANECPYAVLWAHRDVAGAGLGTYDVRYMRTINGNPDFYLDPSHGIPGGPPFINETWNSSATGEPWGWPYEDATRLDTVYYDDMFRQRGHVIRGVIDEDSKINLNVYDNDPSRRLLEALFGDESFADRFVDRMDPLDDNAMWTTDELPGWMDRQGLGPFLPGAFGSIMRAVFGDDSGEADAGLPGRDSANDHVVNLFERTNGDIERLNDEGIADVLDGGVGDLVTVHSAYIKDGSDNDVSPVNVNTAGLRVLQAVLGLTPDGDVAEGIPWEAHTAEFVAAAIISYRSGERLYYGDPYNLGDNQYFVFEDYCNGHQNHPGLSRAVWSSNVCEDAENPFDGVDTRREADGYDDAEFAVGPVNPGPLQCAALIDPYFAAFLTDGLDNDGDGVKDEYKDLFDPGFESIDDHEDYSEAWVFPGGARGEFEAFIDYLRNYGWPVFRYNQNTPFRVMTLVDTEGTPGEADIAVRDLKANADPSDGVLYTVPFKFNSQVFTIISQGRVNDRRGRPVASAVVKEVVRRDWQ